MVETSTGTYVYIPKPPTVTHCSNCQESIGPQKISNGRCLPCDIYFGRSGTERPLQVREKTAAAKVRKARLAELNISVPSRKCRKCRKSRKSRNAPSSPSCVQVDIPTLASSAAASESPLLVPSVRYFSPTSAPEPSTDGLSNKAVTLRMSLNQTVPTYQMARSLTTVTEVLCEWRVGINGDYAVSRLEEEWGTAWRAYDVALEGRFYNRKGIIDEVDRLAKLSGTSIDDATASLEQRGASEDWTLYKLTEALKEERKVGESKPPRRPPVYSGPLSCSN